MVTCEQLGKELIKLGNLPLKIRVKKDGDYVVLTMINEFDLTIKSASQTSYGDINLARLTIVDNDDA